MFFLEDLKVVAIAKLQQKLQDLWISDSFPECIREIYATTPENYCEMRSAVVEVAKVHVRELGSKDVFKDLIREGGNAAVQYCESNKSRVPYSAWPATSYVPAVAATVAMPVPDQWPLRITICTLGCNRSGLRLTLHFQAF